MSVTIEKNELVIRLPVAPRPSKSGKSVVIASTNGNVVCSAVFEGKPVTIGVNAYTKPQTKQQACRECDSAGCW